MAASVERRAACGASYNACAGGATPCKFETRQPARPVGKATADRQFQRRVGRRYLEMSVISTNGSPAFSNNNASGSVAASPRFRYAFEVFPHLTHKTCGGGARRSN